ncbi:NUDIX hydrolase [Oryzihumus leptocrescens]|uniref:Mutator protein MutT n=1 Tax=Oryzihumus leptocrescens TaxID=297536 RepID=A0A542Z9T1_9MICO|nr:NUDIX domain-containing protein [Oryzihumus leptocrescens]TQL57094.1 mutator protein MutT [Oryzihumus leptocrescens]
MGDQPKYSVSVAGVVIDEAGHVLVIQRRDNGAWEAPGGILEPGETFEQGVIREVREETGITVEVERLTGVYKNMTRDIVALVYRCRAASGAAEPSDEARRVLWVVRDDVDSLMTPAFAIRVHDALADVPASRAHDGTDILERS